MAPTISPGGARFRGPYRFDPQAGRVVRVGQIQGG